MVSFNILTSWHVRCFNIQFWNENQNAHLLIIHVLLFYLKWWYGKVYWPSIFLPIPPSMYLLGVWYLLENFTWNNVFCERVFLRTLVFCHPCMSVSNLLNSLPILSAQNMSLILKFWNLTKLKHSVIKSGHSAPSYP